MLMDGAGILVYDGLRTTFTMKDLWVHGEAARLSRVDNLPFPDFASANHTHGSLPQLSWRGKRKSRSWPPHRLRLCPWITLSRAKAEHGRQSRPRLALPILCQGAWTATPAPHT